MATTPMGGFDMRSDIAATLSEAGSGELQTGTGSDTAMSNDANPDPGQTDGNPEAPESTGTEQQDDFQLDFNKEPGAESEDIAAKPEENTEATENVDPDAEIGALLATTRGKRIYSAFKTFRELEKSPEEGGIGMSPTVEQVRDFFDSHTDMQGMRADFQSGDPASTDAWANYWFGRREDGSLRPGAVQAAAKLPEVLERTNLPAFLEMGRPFVERFNATFITGMMGKANEYSALAQQAPDPQLKAKYEAEAQGAYYAAQHAYHNLNGKFMDPAEFANGRMPAPTHTQSNSRESQLQMQLRTAQEELQRMRTGRTEQEVQAFTGEVDRRLDGALMSDVEQALAPVKQMVKDGLITERQYNANVNDLVARVREVAGKNPNLNRLLSIQYQNVVNSRSRDDISDLVKQYRQTWFNAIREFRKEYIKTAGHVAKSASDERHAQLQRTTSKGSPNGGAPVAQDISAAIPRSPGQSRGDWLKADLKRTMQG